MKNVLKQQVLLLALVLAIPSLASSSDSTASSSSAGAGQPWGPVCAKWCLAGFASLKILKQVCRRTAIEQLATKKNGKIDLYMKARRKALGFDVEEKKDQPLELVNLREESPSLRNALNLRECRQKTPALSFGRIGYEICDFFRFW